MYNEKNEKFSTRDVILQLLFVVLFVFILFWLFPTKNYLDKKVDPLYNASPVYIDNYNQNVDAMKNAATNYFTTSRLPEKVGDTVRLTLSEMLDKKLLLPFNDKNGNQCDVHNSYVEMTKMEDEYILKVNLKCTEMDAYILVHLGCYDYCETDVCEKKDDTKPVVNKPVVNKPTTPTKPKPVDPKPVDPKPVDPKPETKKTYYEYILKQSVPDTIKYVTFNHQVSGEGLELDKERSTVRYDNVYETKKVTKIFYSMAHLNNSKTAFNYTINLDAIPNNATNIKLVTAPTKFANQSNLNEYKNSRLDDISLVGKNNCRIPNNLLNVNSILDDYSLTSKFNERNRTMDINISGVKFDDISPIYISSLSGCSDIVNDYRYLTGVKFALSWEEPTEYIIGKNKVYLWVYKQTIKGGEVIIDKKELTAPSKALVDAGYVLNRTYQK